MTRLAAVQRWPAGAEGAPEDALDAPGRGRRRPCTMIGVLAAQFQRDALERLRRLDGHLAPDVGRAGEGDDGHVGMLRRAACRRRCRGP